MIELFAQIFVAKLSKIRVWDPGSGSRGQKGTGSRILIRNTVRKEYAKNLRKQNICLVFIFKVTDEISRIQSLIRIR